MELERVSRNFFTHIKKHRSLAFTFNQVYYMLHLEIWNCFVSARNSPVKKRHKFSALFWAT